MKIKIESRRDYELYLVKELKGKGYPDGIYKVLLEVMMTAFDDGVRYVNNDLKVEINE